MTTPIRVISTAIKSRRVIRFRYKFLMRRVEPYTLGYDKRGQLTLHGWQLSGLRPRLRNFRLARLSDVSTTDARFDEPRRGYDRSDSTLTQILARV